MNRRVFLKSSSAATLLSSFPFITGFSCNTTTIADFVSLIGKYGAKLATSLNEGAIAAQILSLSSQIAIDITNWQSGSSATLAIQTIQDLLNLIGTIPVLGPDIALADLLLSALSGLLLLLPPSTGRMIPRTVHGRAVQPIHYPDASKKSMTQAKKNLESQWAALTAAAPLK
jgi:hypothetical protein